MANLPLTDFLLNQRTSGSNLLDLPVDLVPDTRETAYTVQNQTVRALGVVGAWKVAPLPAQGEPFCSPILAESVFTDGVTLAREGFHGLSMEVEVAVTLKADVPAGTAPCSVEDIKSAVASFHLALEIVATRYRDRLSTPQLAGIADLQSNGAVVVGPAVAVDAWPEFAEQQMAMSFDGKVVQTTKGNASTQNMLQALAWLADHAAARGLPLKAGDVIITGARLGATPFDGVVASAKAPGLGTVTARFS